MNTITFTVGDVRDVMAGMADGSIDGLVTSPPFLALRSYLPSDHPDKHREIGSETTPAAFLSTMLGLTDEWRRLLAPWASIAVEIGDTYSGAGGYGSPDSTNPAYSADRFEERWEGRTAKRFKRKDDGWPEAKSLCGIPTLYAWSLAYGRNLLDPGHTIEPWRVRNLLTWTRPNPPVGALGDKARPATSFVTVACTSPRRWFDLDAVRTAGSPNTHARLAKGADPRPTNGKKAENPGNNFGSMLEVETAGAPPLDWWDANDLTPEQLAAHWQLAAELDALETEWQPLHRMPTRPYAGSHYAVYPVELPARIIQMQVPREVCRECGEPRRRIVGPTEYVVAPNRPLRDDDARRYGSIDGKRHNDHRLTRHDDLGWTDCSCWDAPVGRAPVRYRTGIVLDPFGGSGTTAVAAALHGRDATLIDLDPRNVALARHRIAASLRIVDETHDGDAVTWTVEPPLPAQRAQVAGQASIFDVEAAS